MIMIQEPAEWFCLGPADLFFHAVPAKHTSRLPVPRSILTFVALLHPARVSGAGLDPLRLEIYFFEPLGVQGFKFGA
jgi:hypothetical protein